MEIHDYYFRRKTRYGHKICSSAYSIHLTNGVNVSFDNLGKYEKQITAQRSKDGYFRINYQGKDAVVTWGYGHMCELKQARDYNPEYKQWKNIPLPFIPRPYELKVMDGAARQYNLLKQLFFNSELIICATDDDREGDLIFDYIYQHMGCRIPYKRILFNKQSQEEFQKAFRPENLVDSYKRFPVVSAGRARSAGDFIVGANLTTAMTLKYKDNSVISVGRVQTAVLNMIVERELEIRNFVPKDYWVVKGVFTTQSGEQYTGTHEKKRFDKQEDADVILGKLLTNGRRAVVKDVEVKRYEKDKPHLYSLQTLQMDANKMFGFSLEQTLNLAQALYDKGFTTYPRTDSVYLTDDMGHEMQSVLDMLFRDSYYSRFAVQAKINPRDKHYFDTSKVSSHYAIVPTKKPVQGLTNDESKIYYLVARSVICMVYPKAVMSKTTIHTESCGEMFVTTGNSVIEDGFFRVMGRPKENIIPSVSQGEAVAGEYQKEAKKTEPPKRYTDATLLNAMMNCGKTLEDEELKRVMSAGPDGKPLGLGRPSSQASIVKTLEDRQYTTKKQKTIYPTDRGIALIQSFPVEDLKSAVMTAQWEKRLDDIAKGTDSYDRFMSDLECSVGRWVAQVTDSAISNSLQQTATGHESEYRCLVCGLPMVKFNWGYGCSGYQNQTCNFGIREVIAGKTLTKKHLDDFFSKGETDYIPDFKTKDKKKFGAKLVFDRDKKQVAFAEAVSDKLKCPLCGASLKAAPWGYACSNYQISGCKFNIGTIAHKKLTDSQIRDLLMGKTVNVKGMKGSKGKFTADVRMKFDEENKGKLEFIFNN